MDIKEILSKAVEAGSSDVLLIPGLPVSFKINGRITRDGETVLAPADTHSLASEIYALSYQRTIDDINTKGDNDFSFSLPSLARFRVNIFRQRGSLAAVIRIVPFALPDRAELGIPDNVMRFAQLSRGLVLVTGPAGSGKSTTLACIINEINTTRNVHVITIEDPIEYLHRHNKSVVTQREIVTDTESYADALKSALRQAPDVILLGEMRDYESIKAAITAAETGHLVISTLHTTGAVNTIDRVIDSFPPDQQQQIRIQLAMTLQGVVSQQLVPSRDGREIPVFEVMIANNAIRNMIRERNSHQMESIIHSSGAEGMVTMDASLLACVKAGQITPECAMEYAYNKEQMQKRLAV